jgi:hypothetical protein
MFCRSQMLKALYFLKLVDHKAYNCVHIMRPHVIHQIGWRSVLIVQVVFVKASFVPCCASQQCLRTSSSMARNRSPSRRVCVGFHSSPPSTEWKPVYTTWPWVNPYLQCTTGTVSLSGTFGTRRTSGAWNAQRTDRKHNTLSAFLNMVAV